MSTYTLGGGGYNEAINTLGGVGYNEAINSTRVPVSGQRSCKQDHIMGAKLFFLFHVNPRYHHVCRR